MAGFPDTSPTPSPLTAATFEPHLGSDFRIAPDGPLLVLADVERGPLQPGAPRPDPFSLTFTGPSALDQRTYSLEHAELGNLEIFLVPIGPGPDGQLRYEAVFN
jgi:hypothetical protein